MSIAVRMRRCIFKCFRTTAVCPMTLRYFDCRHRSEIEDICHSACRELELEVKLRQTEEEWTEQVIPATSNQSKSPGAWLVRLGLFVCPRGNF